MNYLYDLETWASALVPREPGEDREAWLKRLKARCVAPTAPELDRIIIALDRIADAVDDLAMQGSYEDEREREREGR